MIVTLSILGTIIFHAIGVTLFFALIIRLWHHFVAEVIERNSIRKDILHPHAQRDVEYYATIKNSIYTANYKHETSHPSWDKNKLKNQKKYLKRKNIFLYIKLVKHYIVWTIKLILPSFLFGYPSFFENGRVIIRHQKFQPLRMAILVWLILFFLMLSFLLINLK